MSAELGKGGGVKGVGLMIVNLGVAARLKYGFLLDKMKGRLPVFRTETQE